MEKNNVAFGKTVFASWLDVKAGERGKLELEYANPGKVKVADGLKYQVIFDKQSGVGGNLEISVEAPDGYIWAENKEKVFNYWKDQNIPARIALNLTLLADPR